VGAWAGSGGKTCQLLWQVKQFGHVVRVVQLGKTFHVLLAQAIDIQIEPLANTPEFIEVRLINFDMMGGNGLQSDGETMDGFRRLALKPAHQMTETILEVAEVDENAKRGNALDRVPRQDERGCHLLDLMATVRNCYRSKGF
jgi:hypothetical protein